MNPSVTGFLNEPSILTTRPWCTVTASEQASGQSSGHAVSTVDEGPFRVVKRSVERPREAPGLAIFLQYHAYMTMAPHVVIIGGGFGGLDAAKALKNSPVRATLIDRHNYHLFQPLLYQVATASLS